MHKAGYTISFINGESLRGTQKSDEIIALDRQNMESTLRAVGLEFPEDRRRTTLFHSSNRIILAEKGDKIVGYIDYCDDLTNPNDLYLSSIQIVASHRGGVLFRLLVSNLLADLSKKTFAAIKTHIQKSNLKMLSIAKKAGFKIEEKNHATMNAYADKEILGSARLKSLFPHGYSD